MVKLGKLPPRIDKRTIKLASIFRDRVIPPVPDSFDVDNSLSVSSVPNPMYGNDFWGDCVIAARAHMTRRFELFEQKTMIPISDMDVLKEYWREQGYKGHRSPLPCLTKFFQPGKPDHGLGMLDSLNWWRKTGWVAAEREYSVYAFSSIDWKNHQHVMASIYLLRGAYIGIALPISAKGQEIWDVVDDPGGARGSWGGHAVYVAKYDRDYLTCVTWGGLKKMTWDFLDKYCDEAFAIVDNRNAFQEDSPVDVEALDNILKEIT